MAPRRRSGLNTVTRRRPDGSTYKAYYHLATGQPLGTDRSHALAQAAILDGVKEPVGPAPASFAGLVTSYLGSSGYLGLAPRTRKLNRMYVDRLRALFAELPVASITRPVVVALRERERARPWYAAHLLSKLRLVLQHGVDIGLLKVNPALRPGGVKPPRRHAVWSRAQTDQLLSAAQPSIRLACALMLYTAQRPADVLAMQRRHISEREGRLWLSLRQAKTGELIDVPCHRALEGLLRARLAEQAAAMAAGAAWSPLLVPSPRGMPWAYRNFCRAWDAAKERANHRLARDAIATWPPRRDRSPEQTAKLKAALRATLLDGLQRRDLRRTAMVRMAEAGATTAQIAAVSGHTIDQTSRILDTYIPRRGEVAAGAIAAWEAEAGQVLSISRDTQHSTNHRR